jgi:hypothetical protein
MSEPSGKAARVRDRRDLQEWIDVTLYPALFGRLGSAFPEFGFVRHGDHWQATSWPPGVFPQVNEKRPDRLCCYADNPHFLKLHGHRGVRWLDYFAGRGGLRGDEFKRAVAGLADRAGVALPGWGWTEAQLGEGREREARRDFLGDMISLCEMILWHPKGEGGLAYLRGRGLGDDGIRGLRLGFLIGNKGQLAKAQAERGGSRPTPWRG